MDDICNCLGKPLSDWVPFDGSNVWKLTQVVLNLKWSHLLQGPCVFRLNWWPLSAPPGALYIIMHTSDSFDFHSAQCKCVATVALKRYCRVNATKSNSCKSCYSLNKEVPRKNVLRNKICQLKVCDDSDVLWICRNAPMLQCNGARCSNSTTY